MSLQLAEDIELERHDLHRQWGQRLERAAHAAERARRQYDAVEPENRLVVRTLEARWEETLREKADLQAEYDRVCAREPAQLTAAEIAAIRRLAGDVPALWQAPTTTSEDRKAIARLMLERVVVTLEGTSEWLTVDCHWAGGGQTQTRAIRPVGTLVQLSTYPALISRVAALNAEGRTAVAIAAILNAEGWRPAKRRADFTPQMVSTLLSRSGLVSRSRRGLCVAADAQPDEWPLRDLAAELAMPEPTLYVWLRRGLVAGRKVAVGRQSVWLLTADADDLQRLRAPRRQCHTGRRAAERPLQTS